MCGLLSDPPEFTREVMGARKDGKQTIDGWGIFSVALGFACLEVVLDRGQTEDWFESNFILIFFTVAVVALVISPVLEGRGPPPLGGVKLLRGPHISPPPLFFFFFSLSPFPFIPLLPP